MGDSHDDEHHSPHSSPDAVQPSMTMHPMPYAGMPMHMYPFPSSGVSSSQVPRTKRRQVKNACTNCQKACKKCDDARPCLRCVKYGIAEECIDSQRKERQKGIKRGPYKKRDGKTNSGEPQLDVGVQSSMVIPPPGTAQGASPMPYVAQYGYPPAFYQSYMQSGTSKPGEQPMIYPVLYTVPQPPVAHTTGPDGEPTGYPPAPYIQFVTPYAQPYAPQYMVHRPDGQLPMASMPQHYTPYPQPQYAKPASRSAASDAGQSYTDPSMRRDGRMEMSRMPDGGGHAKSG